MKIFDLMCKNFLARKTYKVHDKDSCVLIEVSSPFITSWNFELTSLTYEQVCFALQEYISGKLIQECFPTLSIDERENFITPSCMWLDA